MNQDQKDIGIATIMYAPDGTPMWANFEPTITLHADKTVLEQMIKVKAHDADTAKSNSELMLGAWFNTLNEIELADREQYEITSEIVRCEKYEDGAVKICSMKFVFKKLEPHG